MSLFEERVEAAAKEIYGDDEAWGYVNDYGGGEVASQWRHLGERIQEMFRLKARAALEAADTVVTEEQLASAIDEGLNEARDMRARGEIPPFSPAEVAAKVALALIRGGAK